MGVHGERNNGTASDDCNQHEQHISVARHKSIVGNASFLKNKLTNGPLEGNPISVVEERRTSATTSLRITTAQQLDLIKALMRRQKENQIILQNVRELVRSTTIG